MKEPEDAPTSPPDDAPPPPAEALGERLTPAAFLPRYARGLSLLRDDQGHLRRAPAPAFWALTPFHIQQPDDTTCSVTSVAVVLSALRARAGLTPPQVSSPPDPRGARGERT